MTHAYAVFIAKMRLVLLPSIPDVKVSRMFSSYVLYSRVMPSTYPLRLVFGPSKTLGGMDFWSLKISGKLQR